MKRFELRKKALAKEAKIKKLENDLIELERQNCLISDRSQQFTEQKEDFLISGRPKVYEERLIGRVHWKDKFKDDNTGECLIIERSRIVRIDGAWQI